MMPTQQQKDRKELANISRRLKQQSNKLEDGNQLKIALWSYSKDILDISSRMVTKDEFIGMVLRSSPKI